MNIYGRAAQQQQVASLLENTREEQANFPTLPAMHAQADSIPHLRGQLEAEVAEELCEGGGQVEARQGLADAVAVALAEGDEALRLAPAHRRRALRVLRARLQQPSPLSALCDGEHTA